MKKKEDESRTERIYFRVSEKEKSVIKKKAALSNLSVSDYCRKTSLNKIIKARFTEEEKGIYKHLAKYKANFFAISNMFKKGDPGISELTQRTANEIGEIINKTR